MLSKTDIKLSLITMEILLCIAAVSNLESRTYQFISIVAAELITILIIITIGNEEDWGEL